MHVPDGLLYLKRKLSAAASEASAALTSAERALQGALGEHSATGHVLRAVYSEARSEALEYIGARFGRGARLLASSVIPGADGEEVTMGSLLKRIQLLETEMEYVRAGEKVPQRSHLAAALAAVTPGFLGRIFDAVSSQLQEGVGWE